jgi:hypothetical protein
MQHTIIYEEQVIYNNGMMIHGMYIIKETKFKVIQNEYNQINLHIIISSNGKIK